MITEFKIYKQSTLKRVFENNNIIPLDEDELTYLFSQKYIEEYFDEHYKIDIEEASNAINFWNYVDLDDVRDGLIDELANSTDIGDKKFNKTDYIYYLKENILNDNTTTEYGWAKDYLEKYVNNFNLNVKDVGDNMSRFEDILYHMDEEELVELISDLDKSNDFLKKYFEDEFEHSHPENILIELYGKHAIKYGNLYTYLSRFIDKAEDDIIDDYRDRIQFETKYEFIRDSIYLDQELQKKLIEINPNSVQALFDIMDDKSIGTTYDFQKRYLNFMSEGEDSEYPQILKNINDKFGLDPKIKKEYIDYTYLIDSETFNL